MSDPTVFTESPYLFNTYARQPVTFVRGKGPWVWDTEGKRYLDFFSGLAVCNLGHANRPVARAVSHQIRTLVHTSNIYSTAPQRELAKVLSTRTFGGKIFLTNSGAEANEGALKLARRFGSVHPGPDGPRHEIIVFDSAFHGRTFGALSATPQKKYHEGFGPLLPGFPVARYGDVESVRSFLSARTCAVLVEPIQGEGGVRTVPPSFFKNLYDLCRERNVLLMFDEVQTGIGRTGTLFAYQNPEVVSAGVIPDVMSIAKGLANGLPMGAILARGEIADLIRPGDHATTFGGGPVPSQAALAVLNQITPSLLSDVQRLGSLIRKEISGWMKEFPFIKEVRGKGLMIGIELDQPGAEIVQTARKAGLLINCTAGNVIRLLPPFVLTRAQTLRGLKLLKSAFKTLGEKS
ncbi:MAG: aspartate aminotransferase family protein [Elusimicrobia bacterium]|nr:aspartate aminotransferase family protein [Elusimicrobiota bacterium]